MSQSLQTAIARQRMLLHGRLSGALSRLVVPSQEAWDDRERLQRLLSEALDVLPYCKYLDLLDDTARQITANVSPGGLLAERVADVARQVHGLRFMDENIYLRSGSLNTINDIVALNFSCDGSHYMRWDELLDKRLEFWLGSAGTCALDDDARA